MSAPAATGRTVSVRELVEGESLKRFIDLQWKLNQGDPNWVPPLRMSVEGALDRKKHPFHRHAEVAYFIAEREGEGGVGRIAAIVNHAHNQYHQDRVGFFGLFECEDSGATADALFAAAAAWLRDRGMTSMRGPMSFSTNEEVASPGVLIEGFDSPPTLMMSHNPPYYRQLFERGNFEKCKDALALLLDDPDSLPERWVKSMDRVLARQNANVRPLNMRAFRRDVDALKEIYNAAWSQNWGFVPMTDAEFEHLAKEFRPVVDPELCLIVEADGEPVGFFLALPDLNEALRYIPSGRLFPFGFIKFLWYKRKIRSIRVMTAGFKPNLHHAGLGAAIYLKGWTNGVRLGYVRGEASWILEDNHEMITAMEKAGGRVYKRYRIYEKQLTFST